MSRRLLTSVFTAAALAFALPLAGAGEGCASEPEWREERIGRVTPIRRIERIRWRIQSLRAPERW